MNEVTNTEATVEVNVAELTYEQRAEHLVKNSSVTELVNAIELLFKNEASYTKELEAMHSATRSLRSERDNWKRSVTDFIKGCITEDHVDIEELKEFAEEMDIELTKTVRVRFTIDVEGEFTVPLDFDEDGVSDESDFFTIRIEADPSEDNIEIHSEEWSVNDVRVQEIR